MSLMQKYAFRDCCKTTLVDADSTRNTLQLDGPGVECGQPKSVIVPAAALIAFGEGEYAQNCFPHLPAGQREFLISGICEECWDKLFKEDEDA